MIYEYYTDGAASMRKDSNGNYLREAGGWAFAQVKDNKIIFSTSGHEDNTTNNAMELRAIYEALWHYIKYYYSEDTYDTVKIYSDSAYCVNMLKEGGWAKNWEANGWRRGKKKEPIENLEIIQITWKLVKKLNEGFRKVEFIKVIGHSNDYFNDYVDGLAVGAKGGMKWPNKAATSKEAAIQ